MGGQRREGENLPESSSKLSGHPLKGFDNTFARKSVRPPFPPSVLQQMAQQRVERDSSRREHVRVAGTVNLLAFELMPQIASWMWNKEVFDSGAPLVGYWA